ncbi:hypothetical protein E2C06_13290 [Dankookia rubra]|uniref:Uncharacterized protein n=1 Tax=Dankookia rubra TaxID=1442381 RepID=A0A4R5QFU6_9PROT|nr:hypothetical protein [Dankookia rubra]TDH62142.1 hypothetical protein E2C06_13290 [Dankookia rubra]
MTLRVHIERLVVDARALPAAQVQAFRAALAAELAGGGRRGDRAGPPADPVARLAGRTADAIRRRMARP